jgi:hypothetical protein
MGHKRLQMEPILDKILKTMKPVLFNMLIEWGEDTSETVKKITKYMDQGNEEDF